jgi:hypothetical protein
MVNSHWDPSLIDIEGFFAGRAPCGILLIKRSIPEGSVPVPKYRRVTGFDDLIKEHLPDF